MGEDKIFALAMVCVLAIAAIAGMSFFVGLGDGQSFPARTIEVSQTTLKDVLLTLIGGKLGAMYVKATNGNGHHPPEPTERKTVTPSGSSVGA